MSMTKYMHPRNIYKTPPNFKQLAIDYPEFRKYAKQELNGKVSIDFKDPQALRALTVTLLEKDFGLKVKIPADKLVPTIPLRLNYLLWIEDLLSIANSEEKQSINGIDIGTGASCVYPLMAASKFGWSMIGTESNNDSYQNAVNNVEMNGLNRSIKVVKVQESNNFLTPYIADFCMCNPPFFAGPNELLFEFKSRKQSRPRPKNAFTGNSCEVLSNGGEVEFISKMIKESSEHKETIRIYTSMVGCKSSLQPLKTVLRKLDALVSFKQTEFCQGNVTRWGLAWTYCDIDLRGVPEATVAQARKDRKRQAGLSWNVIEKGGLCKSIGLDKITEAVKQILFDLQIICKPFVNGTNLKTFEIIATKDTWSHQRNKRRLLNRGIVIHTEMDDACSSNNNDSSPEKSYTPPPRETDIDMKNLTVDSPKSKRSSDDSDEECGFYKHKRIKLSSESARDPFVLEGDVILREEDEGIKLELLYRSGSVSKDCLNQILQYIKNNLKVHEEF